MDNKDFHKGIRCTLLAREYTKKHLAIHGWNISDAYNRLSAGKGLLSACDKEALELCRQCAVQLRNCGMPTIKVKTNIPTLNEWYWEKFKPWRSKARKYINRELANLEKGNQPRYIHNLREYKGKTRTQLDNYYLLAIRDKAVNANQLIKDLLEKSTAELAQCATGLPPNTIVTYDSRYTIRCRLNEMPTFGGATGEVTVVKSGIEFKKRFSEHVRDMLNYIYDIPSSADKHLLSFLSDNLNGLINLRKHLVVIAAGPEMNEDQMQLTIDRLNIELEAFAWPD